MLENKPRRIRDIAHLYLSRRAREASPTGRRSVLVTGQRRELFPGFHVANMAAAMSLRGVAVRVFELSGIDPNAAFFLSLPARVYLDRPAAGSGEWVSALRGVRLTLSMDEALRSEPEGDGLAIDIIHLPPPERAAPPGDPVVASADPGAHWPNAVEIELASGSVAGAVVYTMRSRAESARASSESVVSTGVIERWRRTLTDPVPAVVRDRESLLARAYDTLCEHVAAWGETAREVGQDETVSVRRPRRAVRRRESSAFRPR